VIHENLLGLKDHTSEVLDVNMSDMKQLKENRGVYLGTE
jgi:hypothetical protein